jgi:hypothetical protein
VNPEDECHVPLYNKQDEDTTTGTLPLFEVGKVARTALALLNFLNSCKNA